MRRSTHSASSRCGDRGDDEDEDEEDDDDVDGDEGETADGGESEDADECECRDVAERIGERVRGARRTEGGERRAGVRVPPPGGSRSPS